jgi:hypothetical protein
MSKMKHLESAISLASQVKSGLDMLGRALDALQALIDREHKCIKDSDVAALEQLMVEKENISEMISKVSIGLQKNAEGIRQIYQQVAETQTNGLTTLTEVVSWVNGIAECFEAGLPQANILKHMATQVESVFNEVYKKKVDAKPKIEMNSHLISKLLLHYRQSIKFWQDVNEESSSVYGQSGVTKPSTQSSSSILRVKA